MGPIIDHLFINPIWIIGSCDGCSKTCSMTYLIFWFKGIFRLWYVLGISVFKANRISFLFTKIAGILVPRLWGSSSVPESTKWITLVQPTVTSKSSNSKDIFHSISCFGSVFSSRPFCGCVTEKQLSIISRQYVTHKLNGWTHKKTIK